MSEQLQNQVVTPNMPELKLHEPESLSPQNELLSRTLDTLQSSGIEIDPLRREKIETAGSELIQEFEISEKLFDSPQSSIAFAAIANEYADLKDIDNPQNFGAVSAHKEFIADTLVMLAGKNSAFGYLLDMDTRTIDDKDRMATYDKFTNKEVSSELTAAIEAGQFIGDTRQKMGLSAETEDPFEVRVLNITDRDGGGTYGMKPTATNDEPTIEERMEAMNRHKHDVNLFEQYESGLQANTGKFIEALDLEDQIPPAWVQKVGDKVLLCLPLPFAEKILYPDEERSSYYDERSRKYDIGYLEHEYVHTQRMSMPTSESLLGVALEELRAEHFSGDKQGYMEIKRHFQYTGRVTGFNPKKALERYGEGVPFDPEDFYTEIVRRVGFSGLLDALTVFPKVYMEGGEKTGPIPKSVYEYVGGINGLQEKAWQRMLSEGKEDEVFARMDELTDIIKQTMDPENYFPYAGKTFLSEKFLERWHSQQESVDVN